METYNNKHIITKTKTNNKKHTNKRAKQLKIINKNEQRKT